MDSDLLSERIIEVLKERYDTPEKKRALRLSESLVQEIVAIAEEIEAQDTPQLSATAIDAFEQPIKTWAQTGNDYFIPTEQLIHDYRAQGWVIRPPKGM